ncbi:50S ribosomal protein L19 [Patescibacteria group bacterium]
MSEPDTPAKPEEPKEAKEEKKAKDFSYLKPGMTVKVHQKIQEAGKKKGEIKERIQIFEGMILAIRGAGVSKTITVRKISNGIGVEKIFPLHLPTITEIEPIKQAKVRRAKLYYLRDHKKKLKERKIKK